MSEPTNHINRLVEHLQNRYRDEDLQREMRRRSWAHVFPQWRPQQFEQRVLPERHMEARVYEMESVELILVRALSRFEEESGRLPDRILCSPELQQRLSGAVFGRIGWVNVIHQFRGIPVCMDMYCQPDAFYLIADRRIEPVQRDMTLFWDPEIGEPRWYLAAAPEPNTKGWEYGEKINESLEALAKELKSA